MYWIAFTMGLLGSLHCAGMCGPLALLFSQTNTGNSTRKWLPGVLYNLGRVLSYVLLGVLFGGIGGVFLMADLQKWLSISLGVLMVISFLFSINIDIVIGNSWIGQKIYSPLRKILSKAYSQVDKYPPVTLGVLNGLLPCGMVYLAISGAMTLGSLYESGLFMLFFGLGTFPLMYFFSTGVKYLSNNLIAILRRVLPYVTLLFGLFLIYRGLVVFLPEELNFWEAIRNPVICH